MPLWSAWQRRREIRDIVRDEVEAARGASGRILLFPWALTDRDWDFVHKEWRKGRQELR